MIEKLTHYQRQALLALEERPKSKKSLYGIGNQTLLRMKDMGLAVRRCALFQPTVWMLTRKGLDAQQSLIAAGVTRSQAPLFNPPPMPLFEERSQ